MPSSTEEVDDRKQYDGAEQSDQHGRNGDRIIDRPDMEKRAEEVAGQECSYNGYNDIDQQVRAVMH